jgi:hypothetical protein
MIKITEFKLQNGITTATVLKSGGVWYVQSRYGNEQFVHEQEAQDRAEDIHLSEEVEHG